MAVALEAQSTPLFGTVQTMAVSVPAGFSAGEYVIFYITYTGTLGAMPGSVVQKVNSDNVMVGYLHYADWVADGSPASYTFTTTSTLTDIVTGYAMLFSGGEQSGDPFDAIVTGFNSGTATTPSLTITTTVNNAWMAYVDAKTANRSAFTAPSGMTKFTTLTDPTFYHAYSKVQASPGSSGALSSVLSGGGSTHNVALFALKPLSAPPPSDIGDLYIATGTKKDIEAMDVALTEGGTRKVVADRAVTVGGVNKDVP